MSEINFQEIIPKFDAILERGLCKGVGNPDGQMCIEAAITQVLGLPFNDQPSCVTPEIRQFKIALNDKNWLSPQTRAKGLRNLGIAQIGSAGIVDGKEFLQRLSTKLIQKLIPALYREIFPNNQKILDLVDLCEKDPTIKNCRNAADAGAAAAAYAATYAASDAAAAYAAAYADAYAATYAASDAAFAAAYAAGAAGAAGAADADDAADKWLKFVADLALEVLIELKSPGCEWIDAIS